MEAGGATHYLRIRQGSSTTGLELSMQSSAHVANGHLKIMHAAAPSTDAGIALMDGTSEASLIARFVTSGVNYLETVNAVTTAGPRLSAQGTATDIPIRITPKGTGVMMFGTHTAKGAEAFSGYITIKDSGGTSRKVMVCS